MNLNYFAAKFPDVLLLINLVITNLHTMRVKIAYFLITLIISQYYSLAQSNKPIIVYMESLQVNEIFEKVGDTLNIKGIDYGKENIETARFILKNNFGSYEARIKYRSITELRNICYQGDQNNFEILSIPTYDEKGEITEKKEMKTWKPNKLTKCK